MKNLARIGITLIALVMTISTKAQIPNFSWAVGSNSQGGEGVIFGGIKSDNAGNIYTAGAFGGNTLTLGAYSISHASINNGGNYGDLFFSKQDAAGNFLWLKTFVALDTISTTLCSDMNIDENGNMVASFDFGAFYPTSALVFDSDTIYPRINGAWAGPGGYKGIIAFDANGNVLWHKVIYKNAAAGVNFHTESIVADNLGSFVVTGTFNISDTIPMIFDAVNLPKPYPASAADIWIVKFNAGGSVVYAKTIAGTGMDAQSIVKADDSGNIYLSCAFSSDTLWFGSSYILNSAGGGAIFPQDLAYLKIDANGNLDWIKSIPLGSGPATGIFPNIASAVNSNGEMFFAGMFKGTFNFGASTVTPSMFILKADANGNPSWATTIGDTVKSGAVQDLEKDVSGNLNIIGIYNTDSIKINNQTYFNTAPGSASADAFYIKTNASGVPLQVFTYGSDGADGIRLAVGPGSTVNLAGPFKGQSLILGSNTLTNGDFPNNDIYWTSFSSLVGIAETDFHSQINFYPNPAIEKITVDLGYQSQSTCINVTNLIGENVISRCISDASSFDLDVASLKPGFYLLKLNGEKGILLTSKFVKQ